MRILFLLIILGMLYKGYVYWNEQQHTQAVQTAALDNPSGFVPILTADGARSNQVLLLAPQNCPSDHAQRAQNLSKQLNQMGIPTTIISSVSFSITSMDTDSKKRAELTDQVMQGAPPVLIGNMGKASAQLEDIVREYRRLNSL